MKCRAEMEAHGGYLASEAWQGVITPRRIRGQNRDGAENSQKTDLASSMRADSIGNYSSGDFRRKASI